MIWQRNRYTMSHCHSRQVVRLPPGYKLMSAGAAIPPPSIPCCRWRLPAPLSPRRVGQLSDVGGCPPPPCRWLVPLPVVPIRLAACFVPPGRLSHTFSCLGSPACFQNISWTCLGTWRRIHHDSAVWLCCPLNCMVSAGEMCVRVVMCLTKEEPRPFVSHWNHRSASELPCLPLGLCRNPRVTVAVLPPVLFWNLPTDTGFFEISVPNPPRWR